MTDTHTVCCVSLNAVIFHIFCHVVRIMQPLCVCCVSLVSWAKIRWGGLGWAWLWLWTAAQDGCRNDWEEPRPSEWGRMYACVCVCDYTAGVLVYTWLSIIVSYSERAQCVSVSLSALSEPHGNQLSFIHCAGTRAAPHLAILLLWEMEDMGDE